MSSPIARLVKTEHEELPLEQIPDFPVLSGVYRFWSRALPNLPAQLDPTELPPTALPYVLLLELEREPAELRIRLAGTRVCELYGGELRGQTAGAFFEPADAELVLDAALASADSRQPSLAVRRYVGLSGRMWEYARLLLPLSSDGETVDRFFKVVEPSTLTSAG